MNTNVEPGAATRGRRFSRRNRLLLAGVVAAIAALSLVAQVALAGPPSPTGVPGQIQPDTDSNKVFLIGHGVGVQIYTCNGSVWSSAVPRANLFADNRQLIITHFAGPSWQAKDGSTVVGTVVNKAMVDQTAIPWVLLSTAPAPDSKPGRLDQTTFIQRVNTTGGLTPPASDCNTTTAGTQAEVPYTADYYFWK